MTSPRCPRCQKTDTSKPKGEPIPEPTEDFDSGSVVDGVPHNEKQRWLCECGHTFQTTISS